MKTALLLKRPASQAVWSARGVIPEFPDEPAQGAVAAADLELVADDVVGGGLNSIQGADRCRLS